MSDNNLIEIPATRSSDLSHVTASLVDETGKNFASEIKTTLCREATYDVLNFGVEPKQFIATTSLSVVSDSASSAIGNVYASAAIGYYDANHGEVGFDIVYGSWTPGEGLTGVELSNRTYHCGAVGAGGRDYYVSTNYFENQSVGLVGSSINLLTGVDISHNGNSTHLKVQVTVL